MIADGITRPTNVRRAYTLMDDHVDSSDDHIEHIVNQSLTRFVRAITRIPELSVLPGTACILMVDQQDNQIYAVTNEHVVGEAVHCDLYLPYYLNHISLARARVMYREPWLDLALLTFPLVSIPNLPSIQQFPETIDHLDFGDPVVSLGVPARNQVDDQYVWNIGLVTCPDCSGDNYLVVTFQNNFDNTSRLTVQYNAQVVPGMSGGPTVSLDNGDLLAVHSMGYLWSRVFNGVSGYDLNDFLDRAWTNSAQLRDDRLRDHLMMLTLDLRLMTSNDGQTYYIEYRKCLPTIATEQLESNIGYIMDINGLAIESLDQFMWYLYDQLMSADNDNNDSGGDVVSDSGGVVVVDVTVAYNSQLTDRHIIQLNIIDNDLQNLLISQL
ncbi:uncharacterized protein LOC128954840 [Oppia nitens]|uniref:uncharacterized protein LOC128954840 n=1 Tax=Oppia nitens TaxID=1686743 RepID=UPI0023DC27C4|nr:uncharacterized protein LOC128954840 [Oppia nitens]